MRFRDSLRQWVSTEFQHSKHSTAGHEQQTVTRRSSDDLRIESPNSNCSRVTGHPALPSTIRQATGSSSFGGGGGGVDMNDMWALTNASGQSGTRHRYPQYR
jgi:hypothetical protein